MKVRILSAADVTKSLPMKDAIQAVRMAFQELSAGKADMPARMKVTAAKNKGLTLLMPAYMSEADQLAVKIVSVFSQNPSKGHPLIYAVVAVLEPTTGRPLALMDGGSLTAIRTGAASGLATDLLARKDASSVAIFGAGVQARTQLEGVCAVRKITKAWVHDKDVARAQAFAKDMAGKGLVPKDLTVAASAKDAVKNADIICTATDAAEPLFALADLKKGVHINGIGSHSPDKRELGADIIKASLLVVDQRVCALGEAGDIIMPIKAGTIKPEHIHAEIGEVAAGTKGGRTKPDQLTVFKACGVAVQDVAASSVALKAAEKNNLGTVVEM